MRQLVKHIVAILFLVFIFRLAMQASEDRQVFDVPKSVLLSRMTSPSSTRTETQEIHSIISAIQKKPSKKNSSYQHTKAK